MKNGFGIAAMVVGIVGLVTSITVVGLILCIIALALAIVGMCQKGKKKGTAIAGLACAAVGLIIFLFGALIKMGSDGDTPSDEPTSVYSENDATDKAEEDIPDVSDNEFTYNDLTVVYKESKIEKNKAGEECLVVYFDYTNNSDENKAFMFSFTVKAFQEGVELEGSWIHVNDETKNVDKEIQPGTTVVIAQAFTLTENREVVTVQVEPWVSLSEEILFKKDIALE